MAKKTTSGNRTIKYRDGEVYVRNLSEEDAALVEEILAKSEPKLKFWEEPMDPTKLNELSYGLSFVNGQFVMTTLKYNTETKHSMVVSVEPLGADYHQAVGKVRVFTGENIFDKALQDRNKNIK